MAQLNIASCAAEARGYNRCIMAETWISVSEAAKLTGYTPEHIRRLVASGKVQGQRFASVWQVGRRSLLAYVKAAEKLGAKRGPKSRG